MLGYNTVDNASALVGTCCQHAANVLHGHWGTIQWIMHLLWLEHAVNMLPMCCMDAGVQYSGYSGLYVDPMRKTLQNQFLVDTILSSPAKNSYNKRIHLKLIIHKFLLYVTS